MKFIYLSIFSFLLLIGSIFVETDFRIILSAAGLHLTLLFVSLHFLWKKDIKTTLGKLNFPGDITKNLIYAFIGLGAFFIAMVFLSVLGFIFGINDQQNIFDLVNSLPLPLLIFAVLAAPISEEFFFRALLVPRIGVIPSSILFGIAHFSYGSIIEIVGTFLLGLILSLLYKESKSITPVLITHMSYNLIAIIIMVFLMQ